MHYTAALWNLGLIVLLVIATILLEEFGSPKHVDIPPDDPSLSYSERETTVPGWVSVIVVLSLLGILGVAYLILHPQDVPYWLVAEGFLLAVILSSFIVKSLKFLIGKPRPDFYAVCGTDGSQCEGGSDDDKNERGSFPSGHASTYFAIATFLSLYLVRLVFKRIGHSVNFVPYVLAWLPLIPAAYVGATRVYDHEHFIEDVVAGALIGAFVAWFSYVISISNYDKASAGSGSSRTSGMV